MGTRTLISHDEYESLKQENVRLRQMYFEERQKRLDDRRERLRLETLYREHLQHCQSRVDPVDSGKGRSETVLITVRANGASGSEISSPRDSIPLSSQRSVATVTPPSQYEAKAVASASPSNSVSNSRNQGATSASQSASEAKAVPCESSSSLTSRSSPVSEADFVRSNRRPYEPASVARVKPRAAGSANRSDSTKNLESLARRDPERAQSLSETRHSSVAGSGRGFYFVTFDGLVGHNAPSSPLSRHFLARSLERQRRIKDASMLRKQLAQERQAVVSKLLAGEAQPADAILVFGKSSLHAFPMEKITRETRRRFQNTAEFRARQASQIDVVHKKWNRLHAHCFSEALRLRSQYGNRYETGFRSPLLS